jgi:tetratricopeptide (TPR) repeat protein
MLFKSNFTFSKSLSRLKTLLMLSMVMSFMFACGATPTQLSQESTIGTKVADADSLISQGDSLWQKRGDRAQALAAIDAWEKAEKNDPTKAEVHLRLTKAYYFMCNVHYRWDADSEDVQKATFQKGVQSGEKAIRLQNPSFAQAIKEGKSWEEAVKTVPVEGVESLYWYATNLGKWSLLEGITTTLGNKNRILSTMTQVKDLKEDFFFGAPHRYFGVYYAKIPFGDIEMSKTHFEKAKQLAPQYLDTLVLYAEFYAAKKQDEALFEKILNEVLSADPKAIPELEVENTNAKKIAQDMLTNKDNFF